MHKECLHVTSSKQRIYSLAFFEDTHCRNPENYIFAITFISTAIGVGKARIASVVRVGP